MTATTHPSGRRTAATWVGSTGAFLLVAAAAVFVAVRWDQLPDPAKLALVGGLTGAFLVAGRALRPTLPATGDVLFHLGAFLIPVDLAGLSLRADLGWRLTLLAEGLVCTAVFAGLAYVTRSVVLSWAATASPLVLAAGIAGVTPVPATLALAVGALAVELGAGPAQRRARWSAAVWAAVAGLAPAVGPALGLLLADAGAARSGLGELLFEGSRLRVGAGTLEELGLIGPSQQLVALASGLIAAVVLARQGHRRRDLRLAFLAVASVAVGVGTAVSAAEVSGPFELLGLAALFVVIELLALALFDDDFWGRPLAGAAHAAEALAGVAVLSAGFVLAVAPLFDLVERHELFESGTNPTLAAALLVAAVGWLTADVRRAVPAAGRSLGNALVRGSGWAPATMAAAVSAAAGVALATFSGLATATALVGLSAVLVAGRQAGGALLAALFVPWAVVTAWTHPLAVGAVGLGGAVVLAVAAHRDASLVLALDAVATALAASLLTPDLVGDAGSLYLAVGATWALAFALGRMGDVARLGLLVPVLLAPGLHPAAASIPPLAVVTALYVVDAVRLGRPQVALGAAVAVQPLVLALARATDVPLPWAGFGLCVCAVAWTGLAAVVDRPWRSPFLVAAGGALGLGVPLAAEDAVAFADSLLVAGGLAFAAALVLRHLALGHAGAAVLTTGLYVHLHLGGTAVAEPYVAPVALQLLVAGWIAQRRHQASSWVAYVPGVLLMGGAAIAERVQGGPGWHALVAGVVAVAAVAVGGWRRQAGPMVVGTAMLAVVTVRESLSVLAGVPTWAWLGLGGTVLLGAAVLLERTDSSPLEASRRVVDVLSERFE
ncbi:MAG: SCO7613 C-terminal domain-containing membrane protein [Acidimicrobiia bacterium]